MRARWICLVLVLFLGCAEEEENLPAPCGRTDCTTVCEGSTPIPCKGQCVSEADADEACGFVQNGPFVYGRTEGVCGAWEVEACPNGDEGVYVYGDKDSDGNWIGFPLCVNADEVRTGSFGKECRWNCTQYEGEQNRDIVMVFEQVLSGGTRVEGEITVMFGTCN